MALPVGVTTATCTVGVPVSFTGAANIRANVSVKPSVFLVHAATGTPLVDMLETIDTTDGVAGQFTLPHTDQAGFVDESQNTYTNWFYTVTIQYSNDRHVMLPKTKVFQLTTGQTLVDLDKLPSGVPALPYTAPAATVTSVVGLTGPVTGAQIAADPALTATIVDKGSDVFGRQVDVRDSFTGKANGLLATGAVSDTGHRYTIAKNTFSSGYKIVGGYLMHDQGATTDTTADYAGIVLPTRVGRIWADFRYPTSGISQSENLVLIVSDALFAKTTPGDAFANAAAHFNITRVGWSYEILQKDPFTITVVASGTFATPLAFDTDYQVAVEYSGATATIYLPDGTVKTATHANIDTWRGKHATIEHYAFDGSARSLLQVKNWGADIEKTDLSRPLTMARVLASAFPKTLSYRPATQADYTATASLVDVDATNAAITFTVPSTGKVIIRVEAWLDTNSTGDTLWGLSHNGTGGYGGGAKRIRAVTYGKTVEPVEWSLDGFTPYQVVTAKLQHMVTGGGASVIRAHAGNGWYLTMSATPAQ